MPEAWEGDTWRDEDSMPQQIALRARLHDRDRIALDRALCDGVRRFDAEDGHVWFMCAGLAPHLVLPWRYTPHQYHLPTWRCPAVYLHVEHMANGTVYARDAWDALTRALNALAADKDGPLSYKLLINPGGVPHDPARVGTDFVVAADDGTEFAFSVRRVTDETRGGLPPGTGMVLLAVWRRAVG